jgi:insertion element IS1 protein InsB
LFFVRLLNNPQLLDWECGRRDQATLKKLVNRLAQWDVKLYCTDRWATYASVIPQDKLIQSNATTHAIERNHCRQRHWFGRFKRKSIIVSKSQEMVEVTMALFAKFWVNGNQDELLSLLQTRLAPESLRHARGPRETRTPVCPENLELFINLTFFDSLLMLTQRTPPSSVMSL